MVKPKMEYAGRLLFNILQASYTLYISLNTTATSGFMNFHLNVELRMDILKSSFGIPFHDEKIAHSVS